MKKKRQSVSVSFDLDVLEAGRAAVADGRAWSFSAWINHAARRLMEDDEQRPLGVVGPRSTRSRTPAGPQR
jgi:hypothetical protein